jgi:hypothetical protein
MTEFYSGLQNDQDFKDLPDWKNQLFQQNEGVYSHEFSIDQIVQDVFASILKKHLKELFLVMKNFNVLGNLFNLDDVEIEEFERLFKMKMNEKKDEAR